MCCPEVSEAPEPDPEAPLAEPADGIITITTIVIDITTITITSIYYYYNYHYNCHD